MSLRTLRTLLLIGLRLAGAVIIAYEGPSGASAAIKAAKDRKAAPDFALKDAKGTEVKLASYKGKVVLLNFWATWCGPCKVEIPWFSEFEAKYRDRGFAVLGVAMDDDGWTSVRSYLEKMKMSYRVMIGDDTLAQRYGGIDSLPETLLIDRDGKIAAQHVGLTGKSNYEDEIVQLLGSNRSSGTMLKFAFTLALAALACSAADLVGDVRSSAEQSDFTRANGYIRSYEAQRGQTPESILALSWMARTGLAQKKYDQADRYAQDTYQRVQKELKKRPLDREPDLPLALGASIEVQAQVLAAKSQRTEAVSMLEVELKKYSATSIHARIQKNINLLSLEGKPAPPLKGVSVPKGKPALVFFWAHWCGDCRAEAPILAQLKKEYGPKGLVFVGPTQKYGYIGANENVPPGVELPYIEKIRQTYYSGVVDGPAVVSEQNFLNYGVSTTPTLALVDRRGIADGVQYILSKHLEAARYRCVTLKRKRVTPHVLRHTTAMELLQAGVDRTVIALWLGHESIETTQIYLDANLSMKEAALARTNPNRTVVKRYRPEDAMLTFLKSL